MRPKPLVTGAVGPEPAAQISPKTTKIERERKKSIAVDKLEKMTRKPCLLASIFLDDVGSKPL